MFTAMNMTGQTIVRHSGQIAGQQFLIDGIKDCTVHVLDHCAQVTCDDAEKCEIVVGPCEDSLFVRDCTDCEVHAVCRQLRTCATPAPRTAPQPPARPPPPHTHTHAVGGCIAGAIVFGASSSCTC